ncbi:MAG TPA: NAD(P)/FAD-dependent oxidoreductase [Bacteroidia bacterium]
MDSNNFEVIIIGGSYAGLSAAMTLGRSLRKVLVIDSGKPCNRMTPHSHNFITHDGKTPAEISALARQQVEQYETVHFHNGLAIKARQIDNGFEIETEDGRYFNAQKLVFATGVKDIMPNIPGMAESWGKSVIHCPYCHGYEVRNQKTGILGNGEYGYEFSALISHWTKDLTLFTNGKVDLKPDQLSKLKSKQIDIVEKEIDRLEHENGQLRHIVFKDGSVAELKAIYTRCAFEQHSQLPQELGCEITEDGYIKVDMMQKTTIEGIYACGDNTTRMRTVSGAVAMGTMAGAVLNREMVMEMF